MTSPRETWSLTEHLLASEEQLFKSATQHPFLLAGAEGRLSKEILSRWLANDRLYIHSYIRAAAQLLASIDLPKAVPGSQEAFETRLADWLIEALVGVRREERLFIDVADRYGLGIEVALPLPPSSQASAAGQGASAKPRAEKLPGLTLIESLFGSIVAHPPAGAGAGAATATATGNAPAPALPWLEGAVTFWGTERCYLEAWSWARDKAEARRAAGTGPQGGEDADGGALRKEFIPNWSSPEFTRFVEALGRLVDEAVAEVLSRAPEGEERERAKAEILGRVEARWKSLLEAERKFWPDL